MPGHSRPRLGTGGARVAAPREARGRLPLRGYPARAQPNMKVTCRLPIVPMPRKPEWQQ
jgi:hypothetical protein